MDEVIEEASKKYQGLVPLVYDIETMDLDEARPEDMPYAVYLKREADKVIAELEESHKKEVEQLLMEIVERKEKHKKEVDRLLMKIAGLEKLVETADKLLKPKGGFTIKDITFDGVKLEGLKKEVTNAVDKSNA